MTAIIAAIEAEQAVLGGLLLENDAWDRLGPLEAAHFYRADHQRVFATIRSMLEAGQGADVLTVHDRVAAQESEVGLAYLTELIQGTPSTANIARYAEIVRDRALRRGLAAIGMEASAAAGEDIGTDGRVLVDQMQAKLLDLVETRAGGEPVRVGDDLHGYLEELERRAAGQGAPAISTGYPDLDRRLSGGLRGGQLIVVAGRPKMGKTALALNVGLHAAGQDKTVGVLSQEMTRPELLDRNVAVIGHIPLSRLVEGTLTGDDWGRLTHAIQRLEGLPLYLDDQGGLRLMDVRTKARAIKRKHDLHVLIIDYLQLMEGEGDNRNAQIEQITRGLKALAKELDIAIVLLSQLNRELERRPNKRPQPADLRDSGAIEQDCDIALFLYRDEVYNPDSPDKGICEVNVGLIRQGEPGVVALSYISSQTRFESLAPGTTFGRPSEKKPKYSMLKD